MLLAEVVKVLQGIRFDLKIMSDSFSLNVTEINLSEDCVTEKNLQVLYIMRALSLREDNWY